MKRIDLQVLLGPKAEGECLFIHDSCAIVDPWLSECTRFEVNPVTYYGGSFLDLFTNSQIRLFINDGLINESDVVEAYNNEWWEDDNYEGE